MLNVLIDVIDDLPHDAIISYAHGALVFIFAAYLPEPLRRAIMDRVGNPAATSSVDDDATWTTIVPTGQAAHLIDSDELPLGRHPEWQVLEKRTSPEDDTRTKSDGMTHSALSRVSNLQSMIRQRNSSPRLNPSYPAGPTSTPN